MIAALLLLAQIALAPEQPKPVPATIAQLHADAKRFDGQVVRIHGYVNSCAAASCKLDERPATSPGGPGESLSIGADPKFDATVKPLLPTYVEIDARVNAACIVGPCPDRGSALAVVQLRGVIDPTAPPPED